MDFLNFILCLCFKEAAMSLPGGPVKASCQTSGSLKFINFKVKVWQTPKRNKCLISILQNTAKLKPKVLDRIYEKIIHF